MAAALDFTYQYAFASAIAANDTGGPQLSLATCNADLAKPHFFDGKLRKPRMTGEMLFVLSEGAAGASEVQLLLRRPT